MHPALDVFKPTTPNRIPGNWCNRTDAAKAISRGAACVSKNDHDNILDEITCRDRIEFERAVVLSDPDSDSDSN